MPTQDPYDDADRRPPSPAGTSSPAAVSRHAVSPHEASRASRIWWDDAADEYQSEHGDFLGDSDFVWCPEGLREDQAGLLGPVAGRSVLEIGAGAAQCARWLAGAGARVVALDLSAGQLDHARRLGRASGVVVPLIQADACALPFADSSFDLVCSAFGAVPFVADPRAVMREAARVLRPGGRWVFAVTHPMRWCFPDDPGPGGLTVTTSYFDRTPYVETGADGQATYVETHRTMGDRIRDIVAAGLMLLDVIEPEWPKGHTREWGQWSPLRGALFPGTAIFVTARP